VGDFVTCGQKLGQVASSGTSTAPHLHFGVVNYQRSDGVDEDPNSGSCSPDSEKPDKRGSLFVKQGELGKVPGSECDQSVRPCAPTATLELKCGDAGVDVTSAASDATHEHYFYGCLRAGTNAPAHNVWRGKETTYRLKLEAAASVTLTAEVAGKAAKPAGSFFVLKGNECSVKQGQCVSVTDVKNQARAQFNAEGGVEYFVVVDAFKTVEVVSFKLSVQCGPPGAAPPPLQQQPPGRLDLATELRTLEDRVDSLASETGTNVSQLPRAPKPNAAVDAARVRSKVDLVLSALRAKKQGPVPPSSGPATPPPELAGDGNA
jgi:hypothetical protein